jgi:hypothetical protein
MTFLAVARGPLLGLLGALLCSLSAPAEEPVKLHGLTFPDRVAGMQRGESIDYEKQSRGAGYGRPREPFGAGGVPRPQPLVTDSPSFLIAATVEAWTLVTAVSVLTV